MFHKILHANDGSEGAIQALATAITLAKENQAELHMICVEEMPYFPSSIAELEEERRGGNHRFRKVIARANSLAALHNVILHPHVVAGHAVRDIVSFIESHGVDLLVIGFMGHSALYGRIIGSTTERLVRLAPCTVMVVKGAA
jgi:nucleotide-binding universal stress UspA family protein